jgi:eukaryotic-like serine/threonine-protein kinase
VSLRFEHSRYAIAELIGEGAMGLVFRAFDRDMAVDVALKTLRARLPEDVYHLKKEFRALVDLEHPNLVRLFDLVVSSGQCFFTMELIEGPPFDEWVMAGTDVTERSRRAVSGLWQLAAGLGALHGAGKLHRDIKPSNVLVSSDERLVLVDMGLVSHFASNQSRASQAGQLAGTLEYMAPEQGRGEALTEAADWYSVGVLLYEALTGKLPFGEPGRQHFGDAALSVIQPPHVRVAGLSSSLSELVMDLLHISPHDRPTQEEILARLSSIDVEGRSSVPPISVQRRLPIVGRKEESARLQQLLEECASGARIVCVTGPSGIGKTALLQEFVSSVEHEERALVLRSRCHYREQIPFKAVDGLVDQLTRYLVKRPTRELERLLPKNLPDLSRVFPVLERVRGYAPTLLTPSESSEVHSLGLSQDADQRAQRSAFACLRELLARVAGTQRIVLWIDDVQWGDLDSVRLLRALLRTSSPILFIFSYRNDDTERSLALRALLTLLRGSETHIPTETLEVPPLSNAEVELLAAELLGGTQTNASIALRAAQSAKGSPFFTRELVRELVEAERDQRAGVQDSDVSELIRSRVGRLPAEARELLELICVAGRPLTEPMVQGSFPRAGTQALSLLRDQSLLRSAALAGSRGLDVYHNRVREAVNEGLSASRRKTLHAQLAQVLEASADADPHLLVHHFLMAGEPERAALAAYAAAQRAAQVLAFELAANLLERALELGFNQVPSWEVRERAARALANAGRGAEAAKGFEQAADELQAVAPEDARVSGLRLAGAEHLLRCGILEQGLESMYAALTRAKLPHQKSSFSAVAWALANRPRVLWHKQRYLKSKPREERAELSNQHRLNMLWSAGVGLSAFYPMRAMEFQVRHALLAFQSGDAPHVARALSTEAVFLALEGSKRSQTDADAVQLEAVRIADRHDDNAMRTHLAMNSAAVTYFSGRFRQAMEGSETAIRLCREYGGLGWELVNAQLFSLSALTFLGEINEVRERQSDAMEEARERGDQYALTCYRGGMPSFTWLVDDSLDRLRQEVSQSLEHTSPTTAHFFMGILALTNADLYAGKSQAAYERITSNWPTLKKSFNLRIAFIRTEACYLRARAALALAGDVTPREQRRLLKLAVQDARTLRAESLAYAVYYADCIDAGVALRLGSPDQAMPPLERAALGFTAQQMTMHAAACRFQLAEHAGGGDQHRSKARVWLDTHGVVCPPLFARIFVPVG